MRTNLFIPFAADGEHAAAMPYESDAMRAFIDDDALYEECVEETDLAREYGEFKLESFLEGHMTPVYFGSALRKFGVLELINALAEIAPRTTGGKSH